MDALIVEDGEAAGLARELADRKGTSIGEAVVASLRASLESAPPTSSALTGTLPVPTLEQLTPEQRADYEDLRALVRAAQAYIVPGATSDHSYLYDENGLPI